MKSQTLTGVHDLDPDNKTIINSLARKSVLKFLGKLEGGSLTLSEKSCSLRFGDAVFPQGINANVVVNHPEFYRLVIQRGSIGAGEAYFLGYWDTPDLASVVRLICRNMPALDKLENGLTRFANLALKLRHRLCKNTLTGAKKNILAHYDLSNELYRQFLDKRMMYSSAIFPDPDASLDQASEYKLQRIVEKLEITPSDHVLEIGSGWGGLSLYLAENIGCRITTTTISDAQFGYARQQILSRGLSDKVTLIKHDYRRLTGRFDKIVSIEMVEAVGKDFLPDYFRTCNRLLNPGGKILIQAITIPEQRYEKYQSSVDFIQRYIFPGGSLPSIESILKCTGTETSLQLEDLEDIGLHYAKTLNIWQKRFLHNRDTIRSLGFDDEFVRLWQFYFSYCEGGFLEKSIGTAQLVFRKPEF